MEVEVGDRGTRSHYRTYRTDGVYGYQLLLPGVQRLQPHLRLPHVHIYPATDRITHGSQIRQLYSVQVRRDQYRRFQDDVSMLLAIYGPLSGAGLNAGTRMVFDTVFTGVPLDFLSHDKHADDGLYRAVP